LLIWWLPRPAGTLTLRAPGADKVPEGEGADGKNPVLTGKLTLGPGTPATLPGVWPGFRGPARDGAATEAVRLARAWEASGPRAHWSLDVGEGYAGAAVVNGRVYLMDYDREKKQDALRCLSLADGQEIWRFAYPVSVKRNHGMSRTVPAIAGDRVVALGPKCHGVCLEAESGQFKWGLDLVREYGTTVPQWYAGQCPLIEGDRVILAPGGKDALLLAVELETGRPVWQTPNPDEWQMTHSSIVPVEFAGRRLYVYCASRGVVGVSASDGALLWQTTDWKISIANVPSPLVLPGGRIFLSGGYNAGALMLELTEEGSKIVPKTLFRLEPEIFGATQQTPIYHGGHIYGTRPDGRFVCLDLDGKVVWTSEPGTNFGLGPYLLASGLFFVMDDSGKLSLIEATPAQFSLLAQAKVLDGRESWGPLALAGSRLLARDLTRLVCLEVGAR